MPNIKSAKKRVKITDKKTKSNTPVKASMKTAVKKIEKAEVAKKQSLMSLAIQKIDKALKKGVIKKNTAARKKSRLAKTVNKK